MKFLSIIFLFIAIDCSSQTKKETEDWIKYYLEKYFSSKESFTAEGKDWGYIMRDDYRFYFDKNKFVCVSSWYRRRTNLFGKDSPDTLYQRRTYYYDLSKIKKVSYEVFNDTTFVIDDSKIPHSFSCSIYFDFNDDDISKPSVITFNNLENKDETEGYTVSCTPIYGYNKEILNNNLLPRLVKAFEHLVALNDGKLLKEIF